MSPELEAVLKTLYKRAGQNSRTKHINATGLDEEAILSLIASEHLKRNRDGTVTLTATGAAIAHRQRANIDPSKPNFDGEKNL